MKKKVLFVIHDLGQGGAEKVLVNLVNNMNRETFDITVLSLFGGGVNEQYLKPHIHYQTVFKRSIPGNSKLMKTLTPNKLHKLFIKKNYDIEVSYLEGSSARIVSGCPNENTKLVSWIHVEQHAMNVLASSFRNDQEAIDCYNRFDKIICVSEYVKNDFSSIIDFYKPCEVLYNTVESDKIRSLAYENSLIKIDGRINLIAVGTLKPSKGYDRLLKIVNRLTDMNYPVRLNILGIGSYEKQLKQMVQQLNISDNVVFWGYDTNPYKYVADCDLFVCASHSEGFSTAATEALIVGTPVCTVEVSGMKEMLGENNEYGIVTENSEEALYEGIKKLLNNPELLTHYKKQAEIRGQYFSTENTVKAVEDMLLNL